MKTNCRKKSLTFGEFITSVYDALGHRRARGMIWLAVNTRLIEFRGSRRFAIAEPDTR